MYKRGTESIAHGENSEMMPVCSAGRASPVPEDTYNPAQTRAFCALLRRIQEIVDSLAEAG